MSEAVRSFVAVPLDDVATAALVAVELELGRAAPAVHWVAPELLHLTLKFLGDVPRARVNEIDQMVGTALAGRQGFDAEVAGVGGFPNAARPRVVWAGIAQGARELGELAEALSSAAEPLGFPRDERGFKAHVTLARIKSRLARESELGLATALAAGAKRPVARIRVDRVLLMQSQTRAGGPHYTPLATYSLEAA